MLKPHSEDTILSLKGQESSVEHLLMLFTWCCQCQGCLDYPQGEQRSSWKCQWVMMARCWGSVLKTGIHRCVCSILLDLSEIWNCFIPVVISNGLCWVFFWNIQIFCYTSNNVDENPQPCVVFSFRSKEGVFFRFISEPFFSRLLVPKFKYLLISQVACIMS